MRNKILFFILLTFCLGLSAQHRMANTAVTEQTGKKVSKLLKTNHRMLNLFLLQACILLIRRPGRCLMGVSMYMVRVMSRQMSGVRIPMMCYRLLI